LTHSIPTPRIPRNRPKLAAIQFVIKQLPNSDPNICICLSYAEFGYFSGRMIRSHRIFFPKVKRILLNPLGKTVVLVI